MEFQTIVTILTLVIGTYLTRRELKALLSAMFEVEYIELKDL